MVLIVIDYDAKEHISAVTRKVKHWLSVSQPTTVTSERKCLKVKLSIPRETVLRWNPFQISHELIIPQIKWASAAFKESLRINQSNNIWSVQSTSQSVGFVPSTPRLRWWGLSVAHVFISWPSQFSEVFDFISGAISILIHDTICLNSWKFITHTRSQIGARCVSCTCVHKPKIH